MLPLIRARRPNRFKMLHHLAFDHFSSLVKANPSDRASAGETLYHGLWLGQELEELDRLWSRDPAFDPRIDGEEFPEGSRENIFVRAKSHRHLNEEELQKLPKEDAFEWLNARAEA